MTYDKPTVAEFEFAALMVAEVLYQQKGDRFATALDMENWRANPLGYYEIVQIQVERMPKFKGWSVFRGEVIENTWSDC